MMDIFARYGSIIYESIKDYRDYLKCFTIPITLNLQEGLKNKVLILNFSIDKKLVTVSFDPVNQDNLAEKSQKYLWIGNTRDKPNEYITTNNYDRYFIGKNDSSINLNTLYRSGNRLKGTLLGDQLYNIYKEYFPNSFSHFFDITKLTYYQNFIENTFTLVQQFQKENNVRSKKVLLKDIADRIVLVHKTDIEEWCKIIDSKETLESKILNKLKEITNAFSTNSTKTVPKDYLSLLFNIIGIGKQEIVLITLSINNKLAINEIDYINYLYKEKSAKPSFKTKNMCTQICSICNKSSTDVSYEYLKGSKVKFFMTDKRIFSSGISNDFSRNFSVCQKCYNDLLLGEQFIFSNLRERWFNKKMVIIPEIISVKELSLSEFKYIQKNLKEINQTIYSYSSNDFQKIESDFRKIETIFRDLQNVDKVNSIVLNYIFYSTDKGGRPNKVNSMIKDVSPTRLQKITDAIFQIIISYSEKVDVNLNLRTIYYFIPIRIDKSSKESKGLRILFELINCVFLKIPFKQQTLIESFVKTLKIKIFNTQGYNVSNRADISDFKKRRSFIDDILRMHLVIELLEQIGSLDSAQIKQEEFIMNKNLTEKNELIKGKEKQKDKEAILDLVNSYWKNKSVYNRKEARTLFLLGLMVADVGFAQYKKGLKSEPILKKINFDGMNYDRLVQFYTDVIGKLIQYKQYTFNQKIHSLSQRYFDTIDKTNWKLSVTENVFYILAGYAFKKDYIFSKLKKDDNKNENQEIKKVN